MDNSLLAVRDINHKYIVVERYSDLIVNKFDPHFLRPIFAHIMSDLVSNNSEIDFFSYGGTSELIEEYWKYRLKRKRFESFLYDLTEHEGRREDVNVLKEILCKKAESVLLFSIMTSLTIIIDDSSTERKIKLKEKNGDIYVNTELEKTLCDILTIGNNKIAIWNMFLLLLFPIETKNEEVNKVVICIDTYDIISSWLLFHLITKSENANADLIKLLKCVSKDFGNKVLSFVTRGAEEDNGVSLLWWEEKFLLEAFSSWDINGYEEWIKNCFELYNNSDEKIQECIFNLLKKFLMNFDKDTKDYYNVKNYIMYLDNEFKANGKKNPLVKLLELQTDFYENKENILKFKGGK